MRTRVVLWTSLAAAILVALLIALSTSAVAQGNSTITPKTVTPQPSPTGNGGSAKWSIAAMTFQSQYPKGFTFTLNATSTGGKIVEAGVVWKHSPVGSTHRAPGKIDASGQITAAWVPTASDAVPQWVDVDYWWTLKDAAGNTYQTPHKDDSYADNTRQWKHLESDDVVVYWQAELPGAIGTTIVQAVKDNRPIYYQAWGKLLNFRPRIIIYASDAAIVEWNPGFNVSTVGGRVVGQTDYPNWGGTVQLYLPQGGPRGLAYGTVLHEIDHLYQYANGAQAAECWFYEGDASSFELAPDYDYVGRAREMAASGNLPSLQGAGPSCRGATARDAYDIGDAFFKWLGETYGPDAHRRVWALVGQSKPLSVALQTVTGLNWVDMETKFRAWLGMANAAPPTMLPTLSFNLLPTPTYDTGGASASTPEATP